MGRKNARSKGQSKRFANTKTNSSTGDAKPKESLSTKATETASIASTSVSATHHQGDIRFAALSRGNQCTANCLTFLSHFNINENLQTSDLDNILLEGDSLYQNIVSDLVHNGHFVNENLSFDEMPEFLITQGTIFNITKSQTLSGLLASDLNSEVLTLSQALQMCFSSDQRFCLLLAGGYCIAVFQSRDTSKFSMFDPHSRSIGGFVDPNGCAICMHFSTFDFLIAHLHALFQQMSLSNTTQFDLMPVEFSLANEVLDVLPANTESSISEYDVLKKVRKGRRRVLRKRLVCKNKQSALTPEQKKIQIKKLKKGKYNTCEKYKQSIKDGVQNVRERINSDLELKAAKLKLMREQYALNKKQRTEKLNKQNKRYNNNVSYKANKKSSMQMHMHRKYVSDSHYQAKQRKTMRHIMHDRFVKDPQYQAKQKKTMHDRYVKDPQYQAKQKKTMRHIMHDRFVKDPQYQAKQKKTMHDRYVKDPQYQAKQKKTMRCIMRDRYVNNPIVAQKHREFMRLYMRKKYYNNSKFRQDHNLRSAQRIKRKYANDFIYRQRRNQVTMRWKEQAKACRVNDTDKAVQEFLKKVKAGPTYVCTVCHRALFEKQVKLCDRTKYKGNITLINECVTGTYIHECLPNCPQFCTRKHEHICHNCHKLLLQGKMPAIAVCNKLKLAQIPPELQDLNILERHVIAKFIPFAKIVCLPKGGQKGIHGPVVCVPSEVKNTMQVLPRCSNELQLLKVKLKRKLSYKGHYQYQTLSPVKVLSAVRNLVQNHSEYSDVSVDDRSINDEINGLQDISTRSSESIDMEVDTDNSNVPCAEEDRLHDGNENSTTESESSNVECATEDHSNEINNNDTTESLTSNVTHADEGHSNDKNDDEETENSSGLSLDTCLQPADIGQELMTYEDVLCIAPAEGNKPKSLYKVPKIESMAFPVQFPDGKNTFDEQRTIKLYPSRYFHSRLFCIDNRFARDTNYIFFAQFTNEMHMANNSISIQMRKGKPTRKDGRKISSRMLKDKNEISQIVKKDEGTRFMTPLRGTPAFWEKTMRDLFAMLRQLGTPTFFCTFSAAEMRWPEIVTVIKEQQNEKVDFDALSWLEKCQILNSNPVTTMRMFDRRVNLLMRELILSPARPIGEIVDHFYRVEFQQRGSPHIHCLFWVKDAPEFDVDSDEDVCKFVDEYISCELPDETTEPELHKVVKEVQSHSKNHSKSCRKKKTECRYGFPKPPAESTYIIRPKSIDIDEDEDDAKQREQLEKEAKEKLKNLWNLLTDKDASYETMEDMFNTANMTYDEYVEAMNIISKSTKIVMQRNLKDMWVNGYNATLLKAWNANMDIQYVLNPYCCIMYIVSYITKAEREMSAILKEVVKESQNSCASDREEMKQVMQAYTKNREVSAQEAVARTCSLPLKSASRVVIFIPTDDNSTRMSLPKQLLETREDDSDDVWMTSWPDRYKARPRTDEFVNICMAEFVSEYRVVYGKQAQSSKSAKTLLNGLGYVQKRTKGLPAVIRYAKFSQQRDPEKYYGTLLKLYLPHTNVSQLKTRKFNVYESFYMAASVKLKGKATEKVFDIVKRNRAVYDKHKDIVESALEEYENTGPIEDAWANLAPATEVDRIETAMECVDDDDDDESLLEADETPDIMPSRQSEYASVPLRETGQISETDIRKQYQTLNEEQASEFYFVRNWCKKMAHGNKPDPFFHFVSGGAGTGKSHLIKCIYHESTKILSRLPDIQEETDIAKPTVVLTAFTGTASYNINGKTLHSVLKIGRNKKGIESNELDAIRSQLSHLCILVIDEISLVGTNLFACVESRLRSITGKRAPFGGISILAVGDFYQLPPVLSGATLCLPDSLIDLWCETFQMIELITIMRQKEDLDFATLLNKLRTKSADVQLTMEEKNALLSVTKEPDACPQDSLHLFPTNAEVDTHNSKILHTKFLTTVTLEAHDYVIDKKTRAHKKCKRPIKGTKENLPDVLEIAVGARVMVTRNIDVADGLVNGSFGNVASITCTGKKKIIGIILDNTNAGQKYRQRVPGTESSVVCIERYEELVGARKEIRRQQFPLRLAYACTIHKVQGMTTTSAVVSLNGRFQAGMAYVALSRTTSLKGLHIIGFNEDKIYCNAKVKSALENMPKFDLNSVRPLLQLQSELSDQAILTVVHHNTERLECHLQDIKAHHELMSADILCLTETFLSGSQMENMLEIQGYKFYSKTRNASYTDETQLLSKNGGGVAIYVKENIQGKVIQYIQNVTDLECLVYKVEQPQKMLIVTIYKPPSYTGERMMHNMTCLLNAINIMDVERVIICGDFNEDYLSTSEKPLLTLMQTYGFVQIIKSTTTAKHTLLDLIYIRNNVASCVKGCGVIQTYHSYHDAVYCVMTL